MRHGRYIALSLLIAACDRDVPAALDQLQPGPAVVGAAEATLRLPVGTPLAAFSSRCGCLDSTSEVDKRASTYASAFVESAGVFIRPTLKVVWVSPNLCRAARSRPAAPGSFRPGRDQGVQKGSVAEDCPW